MIGNTNNLAVPIILVTKCSATSELPESAENNKIAVITETAIGNYTISSKAPSNPQSDDIWVIDYEPVMDFSFEKNGIGFSPVSVVQYSGSEWLNREAYIFQSNSWKKLATTLFCEGTQFPTTTGNWTSNEASATITINDKLIYHIPQYSTASSARCVMSATNSIYVPNKIYIFGFVTQENICELYLSTSSVTREQSLMLLKRNISGTEDGGLPSTIAASYTYSQYHGYTYSFGIGAGQRTYAHHIYISAIFVL